MPLLLHIRYQPCQKHSEVQASNGWRRGTLCSQHTAALNSPCQSRTPRRRRPPGQWGRAPPPAAPCARCRRSPPMRSQAGCQWPDPGQGVGKWVSGVLRLHVGAAREGCGSVACCTAGQGARSHGMQRVGVWQLQWLTAYSRTNKPTSREAHLQQVGRSPYSASQPTPHSHELNVSLWLACSYQQPNQNPPAGRRPPARWAGRRAAPAGCR